jgi:hypothetical protein
MYLFMYVHALERHVHGMYLNFGNNNMTCDASSHEAASAKVSLSDDNLDLSTTCHILHLGPIQLYIFDKDRCTTYCLSFLLYVWNLRAGLKRHFFREGLSRKFEPRRNMTSRHH